ncbi:MAG TPA: bifunctional 4-hydroxy-3-methylbut-2-enyl diphosphate reductase/30S ribosomal protein S1, partial [Clostridia bacterium]|nr:bifunctional 4-hydroxy-3-methylbut-2-enyl diphosphate reductase/30S ribosomal protein S1 [Clostridia bacterium]
KNVCTLGPIIHNPQLVADLEKKGAWAVASPADVPDGSTVVIRTHGVAQEVYTGLENRRLNIIDATCPFVSKIHSIVRDASSEGSIVLIAGNPSHPEVEGIRGHSSSDVYVFGSRKELEEITAAHPEIVSQKIIAVSQTTFNTREWELCRNFIEKVYTNAKIFDTICNATSIRQNEAKALAQESDMMIIIGGRQSSNTAKLYAVCSEICPSYLVEGASELPFDKLKNCLRVGVTAGASTPAWIIKEVLKAMTDMEKDNGDISFAEALEKSFKTLSNDEIVQGVVIGISQSEIEVDLGTKHAGYVPLNEMTDDSNVKAEDLVKVGDELDLVVMRVNDQDGTVMLSKKRFDAIRGWQDIVKAEEDGTVLDGTVVDVVKGGLLVLCSGIKIFVPASHSGVSKNDNLEELLKKPVRMKIIEISKGRRRAVGSIRAVQREEKKELAEKFWNEAEIGKTYTGKVKSLTSYGAFVDLGGVDGMIHVSELSWSRINHPSEVLNIGDNVEVVIKDIDRESKKISLSYPNKGENPWNKFAADYKAGDIVEVKIVSFMPFGSFAQIFPGVDGLIHISQIADRHIAKASDVLEIGQKVKVKILEINEEKRRISLSIKEAADANGEDFPANEEPEENS